MGKSLIVTPCGFKTWELVEPFEATSIYNAGIINIPMGFQTDLASIPRILWAFLPPFGRYSQAAVVHDFLYTTSMPSKQRDLIFYDLMLQYKTYKWKANVMYYSVRCYSILNYLFRKNGN